MKKYLLLLGLMFLIPMGVNAESATIDINANKTNISTNDILEVSVKISSSSYLGYYEYTLDYDDKVLKLVKGSDFIMSSPDNQTKSVTKTFRFKPLKSGSSRINVISYAVTDQNKKNLSVKVNKTNIKVAKGITTSTNSNYLSSLEVEGYELTPKFNKNTENYSLTIKDDITRVNINAIPEDGNAFINGTGVATLKPGKNNFEVVVISTNDKKRTYSITIELVKTESVIAEINNTNYTILSEINENEIPNGFEPKKIKIKGKEVIALYNKKLDMTLVKVQDENEKTAFYIYDEDKAFELYKDITSNKLSIYPTSPKEKLKGYSKYTTSINDIDIDCYKLKSDSPYCLIYGMNTVTGIEGWYSYNENEKSLQLYNEEIDEYYQEEIKSSRFLIYILSATTLLFGISTIMIAIKSRNKSKNK